MKINNLAAINFSSKIKVADTFYEKPETCLSLKEISVFQESFKKLENNGKNDSVEVYFDTGVDNLIGIKVKKTKKDKNFIGFQRINRFHKELTVQDVIEAYNQAAEIAESELIPAPKSVFDKYI